MQSANHLENLCCSFQNITVKEILPFKAYLCRKQVAKVYAFAIPSFNMENEFFKRLLEEPNVEQLFKDPRNSRARDVITTAISSLCEEMDAIRTQYNQLATDLQELRASHEAEKTSAKKRKKEKKQQPEAMEETPIEASTSSTNADPTPVPPTDVSPTGTPDAEKKMPPIVAKKANDWPTIYKKTKENNIQIKTAKMTGDSVAITTTTPSDFRKLSNLLKESQTEYYTYSLPDDKKYRAVLRGIPTNIDDDTIKQDLHSQGIPATSVQRMKSYKDKKPMPLVLVQVNPEHQQLILEVKICCQLIVRAEPQKKHTGPTQCHRCQQFGHSQRHCNAQPKCVKCGGTHHSGECKKGSNTPAKCANCGGPHPASFRGCPKVPTLPTKKPSQPPTRKTTPTAVTSQRSFATAAKGEPSATTETNNTHGTSPTDFQAVFQQMHQMLEMMNAFMACMPKPTPQ